LKKRVLIIGGGYGGLKVLSTLSSNKNIEITLIDKNSYHYLQTDIYDFIANKSTLKDITIDLKSFTNSFKSAVFKKGEVISFEKDYIILANGEKIDFDYLVIASGAVTKFPKQIKNLQLYSHGVKSLFRAIEFKHMFESSIYNHIKDSDGCLIKNFNIIIAGAGLSGVEIASEMGYIANSYLKTIGIECKGINIYLIDGNSTILQGMDRYIVKKSYDRLKSLNIKVKLGKFLTTIDKEYIVLGDDEKINYDFMIFTGGIEPKIVESNDKVALNRANSFIVDEFFRLKDSKNIYAIGDVAQIESNGKVLPPTAQTAEQSGIFAAKNILRDIAKKEPKKYIVRDYGVFVALGGKYAVAKLFGMKFDGYIAYLIKKLITSIYKAYLQYRVFLGIKKEKNS
jgi:NADH dehydrogenase